MATSKGFAQFSRRMGFIAKKFGKNTEKAIKRAAIAADQTAVLATPVDTGRARANWIVSFRTPSSATFKHGDKSGAGTISKGIGTINKWELKGSPAIFIANNLPYIVRLDNGWSQQATAGMTAAAILAAKRQLGDVRLLRL